MSIFFVTVHMSYSRKNALIIIYDNKLDLVGSFGKSKLKTRYHQNNREIQNKRESKLLL